MEIHVQTAQHLQKIREQQVKQEAGEGASKDKPCKLTYPDFFFSCVFVFVAQGAKKMRPPEFYCNLCDKVMNSPDQYDLHISSKKHKAKEV